MKREITIGLAVVAGAALLEVALVPGIILGGAAFLVPRSDRTPRDNRATECQGAADRGVLA
jgi:hypothetical protein